MKLLVLGGSVFLGRAVVDVALGRGHEVTLFNRGRSDEGLFPEAERIRGDRDGGTSALSGRTFDACVDTCGYVPRIVRQSVEQLKDSVGCYAFVSSESVYASPAAPNTDETGPLETMADPSIEQVTGETYGPLKALCEAEVERVFGERALIVRPGLIVGPHDASDRFSYWPWRIARGGDVLAPGRPERSIQWIDVRDLAAWMVTRLEQSRGGVFNTSSPPGQHAMQDLLEACVRVSKAKAQFHWIEDAWLVECEVGAWIEMPLWIPESDPIAAGFFSFRSDRAIEAGLTYRPIEETVADTLTWLASRSDDHEWRAGMTPDREAALLRDWSDR